jgi:class 3 adenylate cyclase
LEAVEVALLLTDVEGSTGLLVRQGTAGVEAVERVAHDRRRRRRTSWWSRVSPQGEGDSALAVFPSTSDAVAASVSVNELMASAAWPDGERVAVCSAVHVGPVIETVEGVFGLEVHRCARLRSLVSGGEVVLSAAAARHLEPT